MKLHGKYNLKLIISFSGIPKLNNIPLVINNNKLKEYEIKAESE